MNRKSLYNKNDDIFISKRMKRIYKYNQLNSRCGTS